VIRSLLWWWLALAAPIAHGALVDDLLEPEKAFRFSAQAAGPEAVEVTFAIADGYYMYRDRFKFEARGARLGAAEFPEGEHKKDEFFGDSVVYRKAVSIRLPVNPGAPDPLELNIISQGCADVGVCYVPMESRAAVRLTAAGAPPGLSEGPRLLGPAPRWSI
jgi:thiol:disulfide interchange protein DsbD